MRTGPLSKDFCLDCGRAYSHCNCPSDIEPMDLGEWVNCDNKIPPFEPLQSEKQLCCYSEPHILSVRACHTPKLAIVINVNWGDDAYMIRESYTLTVVRGPTTCSRMDIVVWNGKEFSVRSGVPSPAHEPPKQKKDERLIALIHVPVGVMAITDDMIMRSPSKVPPHKAYPYLGDTEVRLKHREYISELDGSRTIIETFERIITEHK